MENLRFLCNLFESDFQGQNRIERSVTAGIVGHAFRNFCLEFLITVRSDRTVAKNGQ